VVQVSFSCWRCLKGCASILLMPRIQRVGCGTSAVLLLGACGYHATTLQRKAFLPIMSIMFLRQPPAISWPFPRWDSLLGWLFSLGISVLCSAIQGALHRYANPSGRYSGPHTAALKKSSFLPSSLTFTHSSFKSPRGLKLTNGFRPQSAVARHQLLFWQVSATLMVNILVLVVHRFRMGNHAPPH
jgi:hypothetical protein